MGINATIKKFKTDDGLDLYFQKWIPDRPKALLVFAHDFGDHIGRHGHFTKYFVERDFAVALYDQRGHGKSDGRKGDAGQFAELVCDLSNFIHLSRAAVPEGTPIFLAGEGLGAQLIINLLVPAWHAVSWDGVHPGKIDGFITIAASIEPVIRTPKWKLKMAERLERICPSLRVSTDVNPYDIMRDANKVESLLDDPLVNQKISLRLRKQVFGNTQLIMAMASRIQLPALMLHGKEDRIASVEGTKQFFLRLPSAAKRLHLYEDSFHDLMNEAVGGQMLEDIEKWLADVLGSTHIKENVCDLLPMPF